MSTVDSSADVLLPVHLLVDGAAEVTMEVAVMKKPDLARVLDPSEGFSPPERMKGCVYARGEKGDSGRSMY